MKQDIEELLDKYYEGDTTLEEERELREFFQGNNIPEHLQSHAGQFQYFEKARREQPSATTSFRIVTNLKEQGTVRRLTSWGMRIAAGVTLILVGFGGGILYTNRGLQPANNDPKEVVTMKKCCGLSKMEKPRRVSGFRPSI